MILRADEYVVLATWRFNNNELEVNADFELWPGITSVTSIASSYDIKNKIEKPSFLKYNEKGVGLHFKTDFHDLIENRNLTYDYAMSKNNNRFYVDTTKEYVKEHWDQIVIDSKRWFRNCAILQIRERYENNM